MKVKTSDLTGAALDFAVAKCERVRLTQRINSFAAYGAVVMQKGGVYSPSSDWSQGGPIIEREKITMLHYRGEWAALISGGVMWHAGKPLTAAMRCYVASKIGDEVEIPDEIVDNL